MSKVMSQAAGGHNPMVTMVIVALAVVLVVLTLVAVIQTASTTSDSAPNPANQAISADDGTGGSRVTHDPYIDRHAAVVARYHEDSLR
jgi:cytochrome b